jgi:quercetin dioxygenase-like cupin family protein
MKHVIVLLMLAVSIALCAQTAPVPASEVQYRKQVLQNPRLTAFLLEIPPGASTVMHRHDRDILTVFVSGGETKSSIAGQATKPDKFRAGEVRFRPAGFTHATENVGKSPFRASIIEFTGTQGAVDRTKQKSSRYCNPGSKTACVEEKYLFCTARFCVEDVTMGAGAMTSQHSHDTDHMLIAVSDYSLADDVNGKGVTMRNVKSGGVEYIPAGITHMLTNKSPNAVRFVVVVFR